MSSRPERDSLIVSRSGETRSSHFDRQLTQALRPVAAPQGFTAKLMDLAAENTQPPARVLSMPLRTARPSVWWSGAIAAALLLAAFTGEQVHQRHQRAQAQQQFDAAMRVTGHALDRTREKLQRAGFNLDN